MKSYKQMAAEVRELIVQQQESGNLKEWDSRIESWLAFMERDRETPEDEKREAYRDMVERLEKVMETGPRRFLNLTFCYTAIREKLEPPEDGEPKTAVIRVAP